MIGFTRPPRLRIAAIAALGIGAVALSGCSAGTSSESGDPHAQPSVEGGPFGTFPDQTLTLSRWAGDPWTAGQTEAAAEWSDATDGTITMDAVPYENLHDKQALTLSSGSDFDIVYVHPSWFGEYVEGGFLAPIDEYLADADRNPEGFSADSYLPGVLEQGASDGTQYCLPDFVSTIVAAYRTDVYEAAGLDAPETVDDILSDAAQLNGTDGMAGIALPGKRTGAVADVFSSLLTAQGNWWFGDDGTSTLDDDAATAAMEFYTEAAKYAPEGMLNMAVDDAATAGATGAAAIVISTTPSLSALEDDSKSTTVGKWGYVPLAFSADAPGGELIYWNWCIAANSENKDAAYSFLQWYTDTAQQAKVAVAAATLGATKDFYTDEELAGQLPFLPAVNAALSNSNPQPSSADWPKIQDQLETAVQDAVSGTKSVDEAVAAMQDALSALG
jgi:ABC-type glycerol-3-phosphate transport system substrate-binding protein